MAVKEADYSEPVLRTNDVRAEARSIHQRAGFALAGARPRHSSDRDPIARDRRPEL